MVWVVFVGGGLYVGGYLFWVISGVLVCAVGRVVGVAGGVVWCGGVVVFLFVGA